MGVVGKEGRMGRKEGRREDREEGVRPAQDELDHFFPR